MTAGKEPRTAARIVFAGRKRMLLCDEHARAAWQGTAARHGRWREETANFITPQVCQACAPCQSPRLPPFTRKEKKP